MSSHYEGYTVSQREFVQDTSSREKNRNTQIADVVVYTYAGVWERWTTLSTSWLRIADDCPPRTWRVRDWHAGRSSEKRNGANKRRLTRAKQNWTFRYVLCIAKQGTIGSTRPSCGARTFAMVWAEHTTRFDEARHPLIMLLRNIGQAYVCFIRQN